MWGVEGGAEEGHPSQGHEERGGWSLPGQFSPSWPDFRSSTNLFKHTSIVNVPGICVRKCVEPGTCHSVAHASSDGGTVCATVAPYNSRPKKYGVCTVPYRNRTVYTVPF